MGTTRRCGVVVAATCAKRRYAPKAALETGKLRVAHRWEQVVQALPIEKQAEAASADRIDVAGVG